MGKVRQSLSRMDRTMMDVWLRLREDFSSVLGFGVCETQKVALKESVKTFRETPCGSFLNLPPYFAKCYIQLDKFLKRYRFSQDLFTDDQLKTQAVMALEREEVRISSHVSTKLSSYVVLQRARLIIKNIIGEYDREEHICACRFGKNSSVGSSYAKSYLDLKLCEGPLTGSSEHIGWFNNYVLPADKALAHVLAKCRNKLQHTGYQICTCLTQIFVPKTFDKLRGITPNTLLGTFYTYGLGCILAERLAASDCGINLKHQQQLHAKIVKRASLNRVLCTGDLSVASDSITAWHVKKLFPLKWYRVFNFGRIPFITTEMGTPFRTATFAGMGIGFTFPLQTLVFYGILKAIAELSHEYGFVSAYGDDLIYPRSIHKFVVPILTDLGFKINVTKTYSEEYFRESCGSDFYHGLDCRPVSPAGTDQSSVITSFTADLYKLRNNLTRKWSICEIPKTLHYIDCAIAGASGEILFVPPHFPDTAGIRIDTPHVGKDYSICYSRPRYVVSEQCWLFRYLSSVSSWRPVLCSDPYYWDNLRSPVRENERIREPWETESTSSLRWKRSKKRWKELLPSEIVYSKLRGVKLKKAVPYCQIKGIVRYKPEFAKCLSWRYTDSLVDVSPLLVASRRWILPNRWIPFTTVNVSCDKPVLWSSVLRPLTRK